MLFVFSLFGYGIKSLKTNGFKLQGLDSLTLIIFFELFILGILKKYPFSGGRITLFFAPLVFYLIIKGISFLKVNKFLLFVFAISYFIFLAVCSLNSFLVYFKLYS